MRLPFSFPHLLAMLAVLLIAAMLAFPVVAEPNPGTGPDASSAAPAAPAVENTLPDPDDADATESGSEAATDDTKPESGDSAATDEAKPESGDSAAIDEGAPEGDDNTATNDSAAADDTKVEDSADAVDTPKSNIVINIDKSTQEMTVFLDGIEQHRWPVSTGTRGYSTPSGSFTASSMNEIWYSRQWDNAPMPHAIFFTKKGHAIHGTTEEKRLGNPASHGCVRLSKANAKTLFQMVKETGLENTQVVLTGTTMGGEGPKVASPTPRDYEYGDYPPPWFEGGPRYVQPGNKKKRRGLFGRRWLQPEAQGYYQPRYRRGY